MPLGSSRVSCLARAVVVALGLLSLSRPASAQDTTGAPAPSQVIPVGSPGDICIPCTSRMIVLSLGYSFGHASFDSESPSALLTAEPQGNEPLIGLSAEMGRNSFVFGDFKLGLSSFGRLIEGEEPMAEAPAGSLPDSSGGPPDSVSTGEETGGSMAADVRRSIVADMTLRFDLLKAASWVGGIFKKDEAQGGARQPETGKPASGARNRLRLDLAVNTGFLFDAEPDKEGEVVPDASGYFLIGPSLSVGVAGNSELVADLFFGESEVMTNVDIFTKRLDQETFRMRPRLRFYLHGEDDTGKKALPNLILGLWADVGFSSQAGDTFVLYLSTPVWTAGS